MPKNSPCSLIRLQAGPSIRNLIARSGEWTGTLFWTLFFPVLHPLRAVKFRQEGTVHRVITLLLYIVQSRLKLHRAALT